VSAAAWWADLDVRVASRPLGGAEAGTVLPLYLQHRGHSRTIVGIEQRVNNELFLLILDPIQANSVPKLANNLQVGNMKTCRIGINGLNRRQYEILCTSPHGLMTSGERNSSVIITGSSPPH
jgi:hypothetical protein